MTWQFDSVKRIILDMALKVLQKPYTGNAAFYRANGCDLKDDLELDSIEIMALAAGVNSFFNLFESGNPPYLLSSAKVDDWTNMVLTARKLNNGSLSFNTSGTSGSTKTIRHTTASLERETTFLSTLVNPVDAIIPYVPAYTIYGFLFTVGLPQLLNIPVIYPSAVNWRQLPSNALIVGTPLNWQLLLDSVADLSLNCLGASAAATLPNSLYQQINARGVQLLEIYGATETGGIAYRRQAGHPFTFFPYWNSLPDGQIKDIESGEVFTLMDDIELKEQNTFNIIGRKDKQVKIAGLLVNLDDVASAIKSLPNVQNCVVSAKAIENQTQLQADITLVEDNKQRRNEVLTEMRRVLRSHERPRQIYFQTL